EFTALFFKEKTNYDEAAQAVLQQEQVVEVLQGLTDKLTHLDNFVADDLTEQIKATQQTTKHRGKKLCLPIRDATTGQPHGPEVPKAIELLGKDVALTRLDQVLSDIE